VLGCGNKSDATGKATVSGKVNVSGKPPVSGTTIEFTSAAGSETASAPVDADGSYTVTNVPLGECKVIVRGGTPTGPGAVAIGKDASMPGMPQPGAGAAVPAKYAQPGQLTFNVQKGKNTKDFDLTP